MSRMPGFLLCTAVVLLFQPASATPAAGPDFDPTAVRVVYDHSPQLPDGDAFLALLRMARSLDRDSAVGWIRAGTGLDRSDATDLLQTMLSAIAGLDNDLDELKTRLACPTGRSLSTGEIFEAFEAIDDAKTALAAQRLSAVKTLLGPERAPLLQQWVETTKTSVVEIKFRHSKAYEQTGADPHARLTAMCSRLMSRN